MNSKKVINSDIWEDDTILSMSLEERFFYLYLLTNPAVNSLGVYYLSLNKTRFYTGFNEKLIKPLLERFEDMYGLIRYNDKTSEVALKNYIQYSIDAGGKPILTRLQKDEALIKDKTLLKYVMDDYMDSRKKKNETIVAFFQTLEFE